MDRPTMTVRTANSATDPADTIEEEIPLPPREFWDDEAATSPPTTSFEAGSVRAAPAAPTKVVEALEFVAPVHRTVQLAYPFRRDGRVVAEVVIRRLSGAQLAPFADLVAGGADNADFAGYLCGLPGAVIRGLEASDALAVTEAAMDFLPPSFQTALGWRSASPTSSGGDASPSP